MNRAWLLALLLALGLPAQAAIETYTFDTPAQEQRYKDLIDELRCLVCQNQNLADSDAELAQDLRRKTYEMIKAGKGDGDPSPRSVPIRTSVAVLPVSESLSLSNREIRR